MWSSYEAIDSSLPMILQLGAKWVLVGFYPYQSALSSLPAKNLQIEAFVVLRRPIGILGFSHLSPLFIRQMWTNQIHLDKWFESLGLGPFEIIGGHHCEVKNELHIMFLPLLTMFTFSCKPETSAGQFRPCFEAFDEQPSLTLFCSFSCHLWLALKNESRTNMYYLTTIIPP